MTTPDIPNIQEQVRLAVAQGAHDTLTAVSAGYGPMHEDAAHSLVYCLEE